MLSKPKNGWCKLKFNNKEFQISYITPKFPEDWLSSILDGLKNNSKPIILNGDCEGSEFRILIDLTWNQNPIMLYSNEICKLETYEYFKSNYEFLYELVEDINIFFNDWFEFEYDGLTKHLDEKSFKERKFNYEMILKEKYEIIINGLRPHLDTIDITSIPFIT